MAIFKKFLVASDSHGALICNEAADKLMAFKETWKPHYCIHLGDVWDFASMRKGASAEDQADGIMDDFAMGVEFLHRYKPHMLTLGNHDARLWEGAEMRSNGIIREACQKLVEKSEEILKKAKIQFIPYHVGKFLRMPEGGPKLIHGFHSGVNPAKMHFERYGSCLHGHVHAPNQYTGRHIDGGEAFSVGCIGDIEKMSYADRYTAKLGWRQGFLYGIINSKTGDWKAWQVTKENGHWISPQGIL
jgi:predicted phosphodiesterase